MRLALLRRLQSRALPRLLRLHYDLKAWWSPHLTVLNCGYDPGVPLPGWARRELARCGERADASGAALYLRLAAAAPGPGTGGAGAAALARGAWAGLRVLEVGCGLGGGARSLAALLGPEAYVAVDSSSRSIEACERWHAQLLRPLPVTYAVADATLLAQTFPPSSFDIAVLVQSAHSIVDARGLCSGLSHSLKHGGLLLLADHFRRRRLEDLKAQLGEVGLACERLDDITPSVAHRPRLPPDMRYVVARFRQRK